MLLLNHLSQNWRPFTLQKITAFNFVWGGWEGAGSYLIKNVSSFNHCVKRLLYARVFGMQREVKQTRSLLCWSLRSLRVLDKKQTKS